MSAIQPAHSGFQATSVHTLWQLHRLTIPLVNFLTGKCHLQQHFASSAALTNSPFQPSPIPPANTNLFYVKFISGNIQACQGCRATLHTPDGNIPSPPYDLAIARAERRQFRDTSSTLITPRKETAAHHHCRLDSVVAVDPTLYLSACMSGLTFTVGFCRSTGSTFMVCLV